LRILWNKFHSRAKELEDSAVNEISSPAGKLFPPILLYVEKVSNSRMLPAGWNPLIYFVEFRLREITIERSKRSSGTWVYHSACSVYSVSARWITL